MSFDQKRFDRCGKLCDEILLIDPHYTVAKELKEDAQKTRHKEEYYSILAKKVEEWKKLTATDEEAIIPYSKLVRFPDREQWAEISKRITESILKTGEGVGAEEDPDVLAINRKLETMKIDMSFENTKLEDILAFVRDFTGMNILLDASVRDKVDLEKAITFKVKDLILKNVMKLLLSQFGLDYVITEEKVVLLTTPDKAHGKSILELHDIRDILVKLQDFAGPRVELVSPQGAAGGGPLTGATFTLDEPKAAAVGEEQIVDLIKENIAPGTWEGEQTIEKTPNQQLLVSAPPHVHRELREFLGKLRSYTGTMVSVIARFVAAYDDFLDDVGVDIINRANAALAGNDYAVNDYLLTGEATNQIGPGFVTQESARLESYDLRAQTFHTMLKYDPLASAGGGAATGTDPLANRLTPQGGLGLQYQWVGEQALQLALRALHKGQKATLVHAPRVTVFNTQRSHVMFLTQLAYIMDYEPQVSTLAAAYDPVIGVLTHGCVLDVRPIVSNDRKYVTMELRPSFAELQAIRRVDIRPGLGILLDLPWVVLQKAETTVTVPDRGTLMLSGFKDILMKDMHSGVPFLENIPILNFFMSRKAKADEKRRLFILVTPEIMDLAEKEAEQF
jgi:type II secretory pathway component GspD/PulD (secretin)